MYQVGEFIVHESNGICKIADISEMALCGRGTEKNYYILNPVYEKKSQVYTPVDSDRVRMRPLMSKEEIEELFREIPEIQEIEEKNDKLRALKYKESLAAFEPRELVRIIKTVNAGKKRRVDAGKKILMGDEKYIQIAQKLLCEEIAFVLEIDMKQAADLIAEAGEKQASYV